MATATTRNIYIPKELLAPLARYLVATGETSVSRLVQAALREKLTREGYWEPPDASE